MLIADGKCPCCGAAISNYDERAWFYGSPIRVCTKCGEKYCDRRYHEIAVEGIAHDALSAKKSMLCMIFGISAAVIAALLIAVQHFTTGAVSIKAKGIFVCGIILALCMLIDIILIKTGAKEKSFEKKRRESEQRLCDSAYARELAGLGYNVPDEYLK